MHPFHQFFDVFKIAALRDHCELVSANTENRAVLKHVADDFAGIPQVLVSGLVTGGDLIAQLRGRPLGERLLIPVNMLRHGEGVFLDDVTLSDVTAALGVPVRVVKQDGYDLLEAICGR